MRALLENLQDRISPLPLQSLSLSDCQETETTSSSNAL